LSIDAGVALEVVFGHLREEFDFFDFVSRHCLKEGVCCKTLDPEIAFCSGERRV